MGRSVTERVDALRREMLGLRRGVAKLEKDLKVRLPPHRGSGDDSEAIRAENEALRQQLSGLAQALDDAGHEARATRSQLQEALANQAEGSAPEAAPAAASGVNLELGRQVQAQLLELESLREAKARLSEERDKWRKEAREAGGSTRQGQQTEAGLRDELTKLKADMAGASQRAEAAEKKNRQLERDLELEQRRQEHLRQHFTRKASG